MCVYLVFKWCVDVEVEIDSHTRRAPLSRRRACNAGDLKEKNYDSIILVNNEIQLCLSSHKKIQSGNRRTFNCGLLQKQNFYASPLVNVQLR